VPYRFTGKERDKETGLYYYGARYLDPKDSRWLSVDPALGEYVPGPGQDVGRLPGMGGVFNTVNLHVYHYAGNNPVKYIDPDGRILKISGGIKYTREVMNYLRKIDPNVKINWITKTVTTKGSNTPGSKLISSLQSNKHTVTIKNGISPRADTKSFDDVATIGTDATVDFSTSSQKGEYYLKNKIGIIYKNSSTPLEVVLGHELIHTLHDAEGTRDNSGDDYTYNIEGIFDWQYQSGSETITRNRGTGFPREEAKTVGLGEYSNDEITENALRKQWGYDERATYNSYP
jgi:RHS repeat-associated protein